MSLFRSDRALLPYRPNVGILLLNIYNLVWVGERADIPGAWQMPQGGIDPGETIEQAFFREAQEEVGLTRDKLHILRVCRKPWRYDFPDKVMNRQAVNQYRGQEQYWVAARLLGKDADINTYTADAEFADWRWMTPEQMLERVVPFKKHTYEKVLREFSDIVGAD
jgi:putative (di)nucleoside polyphosphate hydrolase